MSGDSLEITKVQTFRGEIFYWMAILFSNTHGTALGDYLAWPTVRDWASLHHPPQLVNSNAEFIDDMSKHQKNLMQLYRASLYAYGGNSDAWARDIVAVMRNDRTNPYFRWFLRE